MRARRLAILAIIFVFGLIALGRVGDVLVDWLWFSSIGRVGVFWTLFGARALLFLAVFALSAGALWLSGALAPRFAGKPQSGRHARPLPRSQGPQTVVIGYAGGAGSAAHPRPENAATTQTWIDAENIAGRPLPELCPNLVQLKRERLPRMDAAVVICERVCRHDGPVSTRCRAA